MWRKEQLEEEGDTRTTATSMLPIEGAKGGLTEALEPVSDNEPAPSLTQAETTSIAKRRQRQAKVRNQAKNSTACFHLGTPILVRKPEGAIWIPIYKAERGDIVVQSLPSGIIEDLTEALMTKIETTNSFDCPAGGIDIVQMGEALITAHHYIQTAEGWMTARQAAHRSQGELQTNLSLPRVYSLCLEGGGNIIINVNAHPLAAPKLITAATMGCRFEPAVDPQHKGSLTYLANIRLRMGLISGMKSGHKHFRANEVETRTNGEMIFKTISTTEIVPPLPNENRSVTPLRPPIHDTTTPQNMVRASKMTIQPGSATATERDKEENRGELKTRLTGPPDTTHSDIKTCQRPPEEFLYERDATKEDLPTPSLTPDTYILIRNGDKASWIQLRTVAPK